MNETLSIDEPAAAIECRGLSKTFKTHFYSKAKPSLEDLSLKIYEGKTTLLMGHNGAGKTTTIRLILGLLKPDKGEVLFHGQVRSLERLREVGYMPEANKLPRQLTPQEVLQTQLSLYKSHLPRSERKDLIHAALVEVDLLRAQHQKVGSLSKGMGRRLNWAATTIHQPKTLILDEPFSGMDPLGRLQFEDWIKKQRELKTTIFLCTHELSQLNSGIDGYYVIREGKLALNSFHTEEVLQKWALRLPGTQRSTIEDMPEPPKEAYDELIDRPDGQGVTLLFSRQDSAGAWLRKLAAAGFDIAYFGPQPLELSEKTKQLFHKRNPS